MSSDKITVPPELSEMVRECSGEPNRLAFAKNLQVPFEAITLTSTRELTGEVASADHPEQEGAGGRVLPAGVRLEDGAIRDVTPAAGVRLEDGAIRDVTPAAGVLFEEKYQAGTAGAPHEQATKCAFYEDRAGTWYMPCATTPLLAFDIETTGLTERDTVTCVCAYDPDRGVDFRRCTPSGEVCEEFLLLLDEAPLLCAFNGVRFDVPFLARCWSVPPERAGAWVRKLVDPFEACKLALGRTFSLDRLLAANGMECKTGSGLEAVVMAREGRWEELEAYCMSDTVKTHGVVKMGRVLLPCKKRRK